MKELERGADRVFAGSLNIINFIARALIWSLLILVALENFGVNITALLAGLGVGGVAVARAPQNLLGELVPSPAAALHNAIGLCDTPVVDAFTTEAEHHGLHSALWCAHAG